MHKPNIQPITLSWGMADDLASLMEDTSNQATRLHLHTQAYHLRVLSAMLRECPFHHTITLSSTFHKVQSKVKEAVEA